MIQKWAGLISKNQILKPMTYLGTKIFNSSTENNNWTIIKTSLTQKLVSLWHLGTT
jgi:hypothetical protein